MRCLSLYSTEYNHCTEYEYDQCRTGQQPRDTPGVSPVPSVGQHIPIAPAASHALLAEQEDFRLAFTSTTCTDAL